MSVERESSLQFMFGLLQAANPHLLAMLRAKTAQEFVDTTDVAIEHAMKKIEDNAKVYSALPERGLSQVLVDLLSSAGFQATAEPSKNGHVDVVVEHGFGRLWQYLGECKIYRGYEYHVDGCEQVLDYCSGRDLRVFCLDFFKQDGAFEKMGEVRAEIDLKRPLAQAAESSDHSILGAFVTSHAHKAGSTVEILHLACSVPSPTRPSKPRKKRTGSTVTKRRP